MGLKEIEGRYESLRVEGYDAEVLDESRDRLFASLVESQRLNKIVELCEAVENGEGFVRRWLKAVLPELVSDNQRVARAMLGDLPPTRGRQILSSGGVLVQICITRIDPELNSGGRLGWLEETACLVSEHFGAEVGFQLSPIFDAPPNPYSPYSPYSRNTLDTKLFGVAAGSSDRGLGDSVVELGRDRSIALHLPSALALLSAAHAVDPLIASIHPLQILESGTLGSPNEIIEFLSRQSLISHGLGEIARQVPLWHDFPVSVDSGGSDGWIFQDFLISDHELGAPPDALAVQGQSWGLAVWDPVALEYSESLPLKEAVELYSRVGSGFRFDHAISLNRSFLVPRGAGPRGGYFLKLFESKLAEQLAFLTGRKGMTVIAEDLGMVPDGLRTTLSALGLPGMVVSLFDDERFPDQLTANAFYATTLDLPTLTGLFSGEDSTELLGLGRSEEAESQVKMCDSVLSKISRDEGGVTPGSQGYGDGDTREQVKLVLRGLREVARSKGSPVFAVVLEDLVAENRRANIPATVAPQRENWVLPIKATPEAVLRGLLELADGELTSG